MTPLEAMAVRMHGMVEDDPRYSVEKRSLDIQEWQGLARAALDALEANISEGMVEAAARQIEDIELHMTEREAAENPEELTDYDAGDIARVVIATAIQRAKEER